MPVADRRVNNSRISPLTTFGPARLAGRRQGEADERAPLVLLHGLSFDHTMWQPALDALRGRDPGRQVLALDLPGHGNSPEQTSYDLAAVAEALRGAVQDAGLTAPVLVGHSIAAIIATIYASRYPARGVVNVDQSLHTAPFARMLRARAEQITGPGFPAVWEDLLASMHIDLLPDAGQHLVRSSSRPRQHVVVKYWRQPLEQPAEKIDAMVTETLSTLRKTDLPYLIVSGSEPQPSYQKWLHQALPQATVTVLGHSGHFPHVAHPGRFADCLTITGQWPHAQATQPPRSAQLSRPRQ